MRLRRGQKWRAPVRLGVLRRPRHLSRMEMGDDMSDTPRTDRFLAALEKRIEPYNMHEAIPPELAEWARGLERECASYDAATAATAAPEEAASKDASRLKWLEDQNTLHQRVDILYVVDGYEVQVMHEDGVTELSEKHHGATLGEAIDAAMGTPPQSVPE